MRSLLLVAVLVFNCHTLLSGALHHQGYWELAFRGRCHFGCEPGDPDSWGGRFVSHSTDGYDRAPARRGTVCCSLIRRQGLPCHVEEE